MHSQLKLLVAVCAAGSMCSTGMAQSINPALDARQGETQVSGAITIPLGQSTDSRETAPRFEIIARTRTSDGALSVVARDDERRWQERRIGLTLDGSETLMLNGQPLTTPDSRSNLNTGETILVGLGVLVLAGGIAILAIRDAALDDD